MAAAIVALHNKPKISAPGEYEDIDEREELINKLTSRIPDEKDIEGDLELGMLMINGYTTSYCLLFISRFLEWEQYTLYSYC